MYAAQFKYHGTTSDLAAGLTELALEELASKSMPRDSVDAELRLWHTLEAELERDRRWQRSSPRNGESAPVEQVLHQLVRRAAQRVAGAFQIRRGER
jgi:hypothetical protein